MVNPKVQLAIRESILGGGEKNTSCPFGNQNTTGRTSRQQQRPPKTPWNDIWNYQGIGQFQTVKIFKDLTNKTNLREKIRIRENLWTVDIGGQ